MRQSNIWQMFWEKNMNVCKEIIINVPMIFIEELRLYWQTKSDSINRVGQMLYLCCQLINNRGNLFDCWWLLCICLKVLIETLLESEYSVIKSLSMKEATKWLWYDPLVNYRDSFHSIIVVLCCQTIQSRRNIIDTNYGVDVTELEWVLNANIWLVFLGLLVNI